VVLAFHAGVNIFLLKLHFIHLFLQEASVLQRLMVFAWVTGLPKMPLHGDMSMVLQVRSPSS